MAYTNVVAFRGTLGGSNATLYTVPSSTTTLVTNVVLCNKTATSRDVTLSLNGSALFSAVPVAANTTVSFDIRQTLTAGQVVAGFASAGSSIDAHVSGIEIN